jgi:glycosyltransferase involved in cell wall biosynthesis
LDYSRTFQRNGCRQLIDIVIVRSGTVVYDSYVERLARSLSKKYCTTVLGWNRRRLAKKVLSNYAVDINLFDFKAPTGKPSLVLYFPLFWFWVFLKLCLYRPKVVHACDLDTFLPCYIYKIIFSRKLVFDIRDRYAMAYVPRKFKTLYSLVVSFEELCSKQSDVLINLSEAVLMTFRRKPKFCPIIMNCVEDMHNENKLARDENHTLRLVYTGGIIRNRGLERITAAIKDLSGVELIMAGMVIDDKFLDEMLKFPKVRYKGLLQPNEALALEASSDVMVILYDPRNPNNNLSMPNKLFEAMMCGLPLITNVATEVVNEVECGIMVDYENVDQIEQAITKLRDNYELRKRLGNNGRRAFLQKYNWRVMEQKLYKCYDTLLDR